MLQRRFFCLLLCFSIGWASENGSTFEDLGGGVRGSRLGEQKTQTDCTDAKNWPICSDDEWGSKCPSGCRMQGLIEETDQEFSDRINKIRRLLSDNQNSYKQSSVVRQEITAFLERNMVSEQQAGDNYGQVSDDLRRRLEILKQRVTEQVNRINVLRNTIRNQVGELKRLEVDIDIKIRGCKGSCARGYNYHVDTESYDNIQKLLVQASSINLQPELQAAPLKILKIRPLKDSTAPSHFKTSPLTEQEANTLKLIKLSEVVLEDPAGAPTSKLVTSGSERGVSLLEVEQPHSTHMGRICIKKITRKVISNPDGSTRVEETEDYKTPEGTDCSRSLAGETGSSSHIRVHYTGGGSGSPDFTSLHPEVKDFFAPSSGSKSHTGTSSHRVTIEGTDAFSDLGEGEEDNFSAFDQPSPDFHSSKTSSSSSHSRTVVSSSSSTSGFNKGGSTFETKSLKFPTVEEALAEVQHDESEEDNPDFRARSLNAGGVKLGESYIGTDCEDIHQKHTSGAKSGIFRIKPAGSAKVFSVYCDQEDGLGGWLLIQQRWDGSLNFNRTWEDYKRGFGSVDGKGKGEFWLGNENLHILTQKDSVLRVEIEDWEGNEAYAEYNIHVSSESEGYSLHVSDYEGTAGDALVIGSEEEGSEYTAHANMKFSTFDRDNDQWEENCAEVYGGGWWYNNCQAANLNGIYYSGGQYDPRNNIPFEIENGIVWVPFKPSDYSLRVVRMKIRPIETD
ncbi:fibrinogen alpha chain [Hemicordylus capensis]|uniref:fibrinogen alpha chain n=1 Tax=Hemicordylus capensis TaxID=884348 RepID=UPI0023049F5E|nr:fibrinogen alpha chain [Hemicordylus capensis]